MLQTKDVNLYETWIMLRFGSVHNCARYQTHSKARTSVLSVTTHRLAGPAQLGRLLLPITAVVIQSPAAESVPFCFLSSLLVSVAKRGNIREWDHCTAGIKGKCLTCDILCVSLSQLPAGDQSYHTVVTTKNNDGNKGTMKTDSRSIMHELVDNIGSNYIQTLFSVKYSAPLQLSNDKHTLELQTFFWSLW